MTSPGHDRPPHWPGLDAARRVAADRGATSVGTQHVLLALLSGPEDDALIALRGAGVDRNTARAALESIVGTGTRTPTPTSISSVQTSQRVVRLLDDAARDHPERDGHLTDEDVLAALLTSDDAAVGSLVLAYIGARRQVLDALDRRSRGTPPDVASPKED